jgi:hypothetical protein
LRAVLQKRTFGSMGASDGLGAKWATKLECPPVLRVPPSSTFTAISLPEPEELPGSALLTA